MAIPSLIFSVYVVRLQEFMTCFNLSPCRRCKAQFHGSNTDSYLNSEIMVSGSRLWPLSGNQHLQVVKALEVWYKKTANRVQIPVETVTFCFTLITWGKVRIHLCCPGYGLNSIVNCALYSWLATSIEV